MQPLQPFHVYNMQRFYEHNVVTLTKAREHLPSWPAIKGHVSVRARFQKPHSYHEDNNKHTLLSDNY